MDNSENNNALPAEQEVSPEADAAQNIPETAVQSVPAVDQSIPATAQVAPTTAQGAPVKRTRKKVWLVVGVASAVVVIIGLNIWAVSFITGGLFNGGPVSEPAVVEPASQNTSTEESRGDDTLRAEQDKREQEQRGQEQREQEKKEQEQREKEITETALNFEERISRISDTVKDEDMITALYAEYENLSSEVKTRIDNRNKLLDAYTAVEKLTEDRKAAAARVDDLIFRINYRDDITLAGTTKAAVVAYNELDDRAAGYVELYHALETAYNKVSSGVAITGSNFLSAFDVQFSVGQKTQYGGTTIENDGAYIDWDTGKITPQYDINLHNDYATPVYIYITPKYSNLDMHCKFYIDLHQTYTGLGIIDSDVHEFKLQSAWLEYDSSMGTAEYMINVENNDGSNSILGALGWGADMSDAWHDMNPFDVSRVEISNVDGTAYY